MKKIKYIFHISDLHIRNGISRIGEYRNVFQKTINSINSSISNDSVCVITGDLLHNGVNMTSESIYELRSFLEKLGKVLPTYIIAGNHDEGAKNRMCSLDSILYSIENIYYLRNSGWVDIGDNLVFSSILANPVYSP